MSRAILVINAGSSSIKFALYDAGDLAPILRGNIAGIGVAARLDADPRTQDLLAGAGSLPPSGNHADLTAWLMDGLRLRAADHVLVAAGHRVVHGGPRYDRPVRVDDHVLAELETLVMLAPSHEPHNIAAIRAVAAAYPDLPQVACFDTAFHRSQPRLAQLFALPRRYADAGLLRYGFHGLSYEYIASVLPDIVGARADGRVVVAHLGNGASLCAMQGRRSVATTMGYTVLDGLMMGTRSGAVDPGLLLHLLEAEKLSVSELADLLHNRSGLLGVSGISSDMRVLEASDDPRALEAVELFAYRAARELGGLIAVLGGLDVLVFTAGIGEHSAATRRRICERLAWTGLELDAAANAAGATRISTAASAVETLVVPTNEEVVIARATRDLALSGQ